VDVLCFPLSSVAQLLPGSGLVGHFWIMVNGLLWGVVWLTAFAFARRAWKRRAVEA
jgi:hypothetical protein